MKKILIIILCYNEEKTISKIIDKIRSIKINHKLEILVINDGSNDSSQQII